MTLQATSIVKAMDGWMAVVERCEEGACRRYILHCGKRVVEKVRVCFLVLGFLQWHREMHLP